MNLSIIANQFIRPITQTFQDLVVQSFEKLRTRIDDRKLYVMFESALGCDVLTDHERPKSVLPLFTQLIGNIETEILEEPLKDFKQQSEQFLKTYTDHLSAENQLLHDQVATLTQQITEKQKTEVQMRKLLEQIMLEKASERKHFLNQIESQQEQLFSKLRVGEKYQSDFVKEPEKKYMVPPIVVNVVAPPERQTDKFALEGTYLKVIDELKENLRTARAHLAETLSNCKRLEMELAEFVNIKETLLQRDAVIAEKLDQIATLEQKLNKSQNQIQSLLRQQSELRAELEAEITKLQSQIKEINYKGEIQESNLKIRDQRIEIQQAKIIELTKLTEDSQSVFNAKDDQITALTEQIKVLQEQLAGIPSKPATPALNLEKPKKEPKTKTPVAQPVVDQKPLTNEKAQQTDLTFMAMNPLQPEAVEEDEIGEIQKKEVKPGEHRTRQISSSLNVALKLGKEDAERAPPQVLTTPTEIQIGNSSPQRRALRVTQTELDREIKNFEVLARGTKDDEVLQQRIVHDDLLESLFKQQKLVATFKSQLKEMTFLDFECVSEAQKTLEFYLNRDNKEIQTDIGSEVKQNTRKLQPSPSLYQTEQDLTKQDLAIKMANEVLGQRGIQPIPAKASTYDEIIKELNKTKLVLQQKQQFEEYSRSRVFETLQRATDRFSKYKSMMIVASGMVQKQFNTVNMQIVPQRLHGTPQSVQVRSRSQSGISTSQQYAIQTKRYLK